MVVVVVDGVVAVLVAFGNFEVVLGNVEVTFGMEVDVVVSSDVSFLVSSLLNFSEFCTICMKNKFGLIKKDCAIISIY